MEISLDEYKAISYVFDLPCFRVSVGNQSDSVPPKELLRFSVYETIARSIVGFALSLKNNSNVKAEIRDEQKLIVPDTIFDLNPNPEAITVFEDKALGKVCINFGLFYSLAWMSQTITWLQSWLERGDCSLDEIMSEPIPAYVMNEIDGVMREWYSFHNTGMNYAHMFINPGIPFLPFSEWDDMSIERIEELSKKRFPKINVAVQQMLIFVTFHELSHWYKTLCPPDVGEKLKSLTRHDLSSWLLEGGDTFITKQGKQEASDFFKDNPEAFENWVEEITVDWMAYPNVIKFYKYYSSYYRNNIKQLKMEIYSSLAMLFSILLKMQEIFLEDILSKPLSWQTHPPTSIRQSIFWYRLRAGLGLSEVDFLAKEWGSGLVITLLMERIWDLYQSSFSKK